ncbi:hypothetical protein HMPREF0021_02421 [Acinetobacter baumannii 6013150]|nr:hypothetical protein HMPREF0021_02421 [Acinetobacter baumannii 6013150]EGJ64054.1 hypothetical protein HMPREF0020_02337 [Acinetobacter baumannii 6013113]
MRYCSMSLSHPLQNCTDDSKINNIIPIKNLKKIKKANHVRLAF